jgi:hypothetical protein
MLSRISVAALAAALVCAPRASGQTKVTSTAPAVEELKNLDHDWLDAEKRLLT